LGAHLDLRLLNSMVLLDPRLLVLDLAFKRNPKLLSPTSYLDPFKLELCKFNIIIIIKNIIICVTPGHRGDQLKIIKIFEKNGFLASCSLMGE
jgi:hypothetical protein